MAILLDAWEDANIKAPTIYDPASLMGKTVKVDFTDVFTSCVERVLCARSYHKKILNLDVVKQEVDYHLGSTEEVIIMDKFLRGEYEGNVDRREFLDLMLHIWDHSPNFRTTSSGVVEALNNETLDRNDLILFPNFHNPLPVTNLREFYRFRLYELYLPLRNCFLNRFSNICKSKVFRSNELLTYYFEYIGEEDCLQIMLGSNLYSLDLKKIVT